MRTVYGYVHSVETFGALDGPGIRYVLFLQGCAMRCLYCHNPDSWTRRAGRRVSAADAVADVARYHSFIRHGGVTLSGGEPLLQPAFTAAVLNGCRALGLHTAIDTAGGVPLSGCREAVDSADLLLLDIKAADPALFLQIAGREMTDTLALLDYSEAAGKDVWIRHVLVPGLTLVEEQLHLLGSLLQGYRCVRRVELLPFHKMGEFKWEDASRPYTLGHVQPPGAEEVVLAKQRLREYGLDVR